MRIWKRKVRQFAVWLRSYTDYWVVSPELYRAVDDGDSVTANRLYNVAVAEWPSDPELAYIGGLMDRLQLLK